MPGPRHALAGLVALLFAAAPTMGHVLMTAVHAADMPARSVSAAAGPHGAHMADQRVHEAGPAASSAHDVSSAHMPTPGCAPGGLVSCADCGLVCHVAVALPQAADAGAVPRFGPRGLFRSDIPDGLRPDAPPRPPKATAQL